MLFNDAAFHHTEGPLTVTRRPVAVSLTKAMSAAAQELGYKTLDYNGKDMIGRVTMATLLQWSLWPNLD